MLERKRSAPSARQITNTPIRYLLLVGVPIYLQTALVHRAQTTSVTFSPHFEFGDNLHGQSEVFVTPTKWRNRMCFKNGPAGRDTVPPQTRTNKNGPWSVSKDFEKRAARTEGSHEWPTNFVTWLRLAVWLVALWSAVASTEDAYGDLIHVAEMDQTSYFVEPGQTKEIGLFLREIVEGDSSTILGNPDFGAIAFSFAIDFTSSTTPSMPLSESDIAINPSFDDQFVALNGNTLELSGLAFDGTPTGTLTDNGDYLLELARIPVFTSPIVGNETLISIRDLDLEFDETILGDGQVLDSIIDYRSSIMTSVPEPSSAMMLCGVLTLLVLRRRKRSGSFVPTVLVAMAATMFFSSSPTSAQDLKNIPGVAAIDTGDVEVKFVRELLGHNDGKAILMHETDHFFVASHAVGHLVTGGGTYTELAQLLPGRVTGSFRFFVINFNPPANGDKFKRIQGWIRFTQPIVGVDTQNHGADDPLTKRFNVPYPSKDGSLELKPSSSSRDSFSISSDRKTLHFDFKALREGGLDRMRVITESGFKPPLLSSASGGIAIVNRDDVAVPVDTRKGGYPTKNAVVIFGRAGVRIAPNSVPGIDRFNSDGSGTSRLMPLDTYATAVLVTSDTESDEQTSARVTNLCQLHFNGRIIAIATSVADMSRWQELFGPPEIRFYPPSNNFEDDLELFSNSNSRDELLFFNNNESVQMKLRTIFRVDRAFLLIETPMESTPTYVEFTETTVPENKIGAFAGQFGRVVSPLQAAGYSYHFDQFELTGPDAQLFQLQGSLSNGSLRLVVKPGVALDYESKSLYQMTLRMRGVWRSSDGASAFQINQQQTLSVQVEDFVESKSVEVNSGQKQRSKVESILVQFDQPLNHIGNGFLIRNQTNNELATINISAGHLPNSFAVTFPITGNGIEFESLVDGTFDLSLQTGRFTNRRFDLNQDGTPDTDGQILTTVKRRFGDANGDGIVDALEDRSAFRAAYRSRTGDLNYRSYLDFNANGRVDGTDFFEFRKRYRVDQSN